MNVRFCPSCRSLILADFRFCPYCGAAAAKGPELADALAGPFDRLGRGNADASAPIPWAGALVSAEESLDRLESDMDLILEELEREGRSSPK